MNKTGPKHIKKYNEGERINNSFTLIKEIKKEKIWGGKNVIDYQWECKCDCGEIFYSRSKEIQKRIGCKKCTASKRNIERSLKKHGITNKAIKTRIFKEYKNGAEKRSLDFKIDFNDFIRLSEQNCFYCGAEPVIHESDKKYISKIIEPWKRNGIDRIDTKKGYVLDNCVPCCSKCNYAKHDLEINEFKDWVKKCYEHLLLEGKK